MIYQDRWFAKLLCPDVCFLGATRKADESAADIRM